MAGTKGRRPLRRTWSWAEKRRMVAEMEAPGASASAVSRQYDVNTNLLFKWRREIVAMGGMPGSDLVAIGVVRHDQDGGLRLAPDATTAVADIEAMERSAVVSRVFRTFPWVMAVRVMRFMRSVFARAAAACSGSGGWTSGCRRCASVVSRVFRTFPWVMAVRVMRFMRSVFARAAAACSGSGGWTSGCRRCASTWPRPG
ncbi:MAG: transposase [Rhodospirillales bacterium]|nr:transposase [Rhodospirillales bacterium]